MIHWIKFSNKLLILNRLQRSNSKGSKSIHCSSFTRYLSIEQAASYCLPPDTRRRQLTALSSAVRTEFTEFTCPKDVGLERPIEELSVNWTPRPPATLHTLGRSSLDRRSLQSLRQLFVFAQSKCEEPNQLQALGGFSQLSVLS